MPDDLTVRIAAAMADRDRILSALDVEDAKRFIVAHGGTIPRRPLDWLQVLHLARFDVMTTTDEDRTDSRIYLARTGGQSIGTLPATSPYLTAAMDLIFPRDLFASSMTELEAPR